MQEQANLNKASDPSENILNDFMAFGPKASTALGKGLWLFGKNSNALVRSLWQSIAEQGIKETGKHVAKEALKAMPGIAVSIGLG